VRRKNAAVDTGVVDGGFQFGRADLGALAADSLCTLIVHKCASSDTDADHGSHVAGIIGATYDNPAGGGRSIGISGANPVARMHGVPVGFTDGQVPLPQCQLVPSLCNTLVHALQDSLVEVWDLLLSAKESGSLTTMRAVNFSMSYHISDVPLHDLADMGKPLRRVAERVARDGVVIIAAADNDSSAGTRFHADRAGGFNWARRNWTSSDPNPILVVEATGNVDASGAYPANWLSASLFRASFSNDNGDLTAPGVHVWSTGSSQNTRCGDQLALGASYCTMDGTSMAAPFVTGPVGYLLAFNPMLDVPGVRQAVTTWARSDTGSTPRIDAYATLMAQPGAGLALVDVNACSAALRSRGRLRKRTCTSTRTMVLRPTPSPRGRRPIHTTRPCWTRIGRRSASRACAALSGRGPPSSVTSWTAPGRPPSTPTRPTVSSWPRSSVHCPTTLT